MPKVEAAGKDKQSDNNENPDYTSSFHDKPSSGLHWSNLFMQAAGGSLKSRHNSAESVAASYLLINLYILFVELNHRSQNQWMQMF